MCLEYKRGGCYGHETIKKTGASGGPSKGQVPQQQDSHTRSLIKALSWRVSAFIITVSVVLVLTGEAAFAAAIGIADAAIKIGIYYLHERVWNRTNFGRNGGRNQSN